MFSHETVAWGTNWLKNSHWLTRVYYITSSADWVCLLKLHLKFNCLKKMDAWQLLKIFKFEYYWNWICFTHERLGLSGSSTVLRNWAGIAKVLYKIGFFLAAAYVHRTVLESVTYSWEPGVKLFVGFLNT